jgi:iron complex outermembrane receptor protein
MQVRLGAKHTGETPLRASNNLAVDSYTVFNLGATYDTKVQGHATTFRASVNNLTDKQYWMYQYADYIKAGDPRSFHASATVHF